MNILLMLIGFSILVGVHELGHFLVARLCGMSVASFSIGFGPVLFRWQWGDTEYRISAIPLGGYVQIVGHLSNQQANSQLLDIFKQRGVARAIGLIDPSTWYCNKSGFRQFLTILAGPAFSLLLAIPLFWGSLMLNGSMQVASPIIVERVNENSPASQAGIVAGDALVAVGSTSVETYTDFVLAIAASDLTEMVSLTVERQGEAVETEVFFPNTLSPQLGVVLVGEYVRYGPLEAVPKSFTAAISMIALQSEAMFHLFTGEASTAGVSGPIGIFSIGASAAGSGAGSFVSFLALITVALGLFNLLPVPVLDGGHLIFATYKMLTGKNVSAQMQHRLMVLGMALLLTLIVFASFQDISRLFTKSSP